MKCDRQFCENTVTHAPWFTTIGAYRFRCDDHLGTAVSPLPINGERWGQVADLKPGRTYSQVLSALGHPNYGEGFAKQALTIWIRSSHSLHQICYQQIHVQWWEQPSPLS